MAGDRSKFAGGDQRYLRDEQYRTSDRLALRARLHERWSTATTPWFAVVGGHLALEPDVVVLEVGCGAGWLWEHLAPQLPTGVSLTLTDLSAGMVEEATARVRGHAPGAAVDGRTADAGALPFADASFDRVVANHMLYHLPEPALAVAELARVVRPGGRVIVATNGRRHMQELWAIRAAVFGTEPVDQTVDVFGVETGFPVLRDHFSDVHWHAHPDGIRCDDPEDVLAYLCSTPPGEDAGPGQLAAVRAAVARAFIAGDGTMAITKDTGCFVCTRPRAAVTAGSAVDLRSADARR